jgi:hypothetical protein
MPGHQGTQERGRGNQTERNRESGDTMRNRNREDSGGITNRSLSEEMDEQEQLPERGRGQSER